MILFVNLTCEEKMKAETIKELARLRALSERHSGLAVYSTFTYDVQGGDDLTSKDIARVLQQWGYLSPENIKGNMRFLAKMDVNGREMHNLYKFLKRQSPLFIHRYAGSRRIADYYTKFLCNRYGEVKHYYQP